MNSVTGYNTQFKLSRERERGRKIARKLRKILASVSKKGFGLVITQ